ncbi:MAG: GNAT family N-acetyltransferase [bacterium]|nr:GNAT family N-acetyltransferase [bacterium]
MPNDEPEPNSISIISLTPDKWETYRDIRLKGLLEDPQAFARSYKEEVAFPQEKWLQRASSPYGFMAFKNDIPLGTMGAFISGEPDNKVANIVGAFVSKDARRKGVGSKLLKAVLDKIKQESSVKTVKLSVNKSQTPAIELYEKFGFRIIGEKTQKMGDGKEHTEYLMELTL